MTRNVVSIIERQQLSPMQAELQVLAGKINESYRDGLIGSLKHYHDCGTYLIEAKARAGHGRWLLWVEQNLDFDERTAQLLIRFAKTKSTSDLDNLTPDEAEALSRELWGNQEAVRKTDSGNDEWNTPPEYIEAARQVMGAIDLDPASNDVAQHIVKAKAYFTKETNGLDKPWRGRVWLNPPYSKGLMDKFVDKLLDEIKNRNVIEAIMLTNNHTDATWFQSAQVHAAAICFTKGRIRFVDPSGEKDDGTPPRGQSFFYCGIRNLDRFRETFGEYGFIAEPYRTEGMDYEVCIPTSDARLQAQRQPRSEESSRSGVCSIPFREPRGVV